ncbi:MAG: ParA family protein, partial [Acidobacteriota bacterium]
SSLSFIDPASVNGGAYELFSEPDRPLEELVYQTNTEGLSIIPSRISLAKLEAKLIGDFDAAFKLRDRLEKLKGKFDIIIVDTPPTLGILTVNGMVAAQHIIIPIQSSYFALEGTDDLLETIEKIKSRPNPDLNLLGVVVTLFDRRTTISKDVEAHIRSVFGRKAFKTVISRSVRLEESPAHKKPIFDYAPRSSGAVEYESLSKEVLKRV